MNLILNWRKVMFLHSNKSVTFWMFIVYMYDSKLEKGINPDLYDFQHLSPGVTNEA